ncbi:MAG TPA: type III pantothenate kinase, partial [Bacillota bacterium]|nr:type III pantothenate kinase [Bacillota bacterium]
MDGNVGGQGSYQTLLTIDIGNTNIVFGVFRDDRLQTHWRVKTD